MHSLFNLMPGISQGLLSFPEWNYVRDGLRRNLETILRYYRRHPTAVRSSHFLVHILHAITVPKSQNLERYYDNVDAIALNVSMALKMTSSIYKGHLFKNVFYGPESREILVAHNESFDIFSAHRNWMELQPVQVLRHPISDLDLGIPDSQQDVSESGLAVIAINIPMLAIQYRAFRQQEEYLVGESDSQRSIYQFIRMYVLPNMLFSHLDIALFNRIFNLHRGAPLGNVGPQHSFYLTDYSKQVTKIQLGILERLSETGHNFTGILRSIPAVVQNNMDEVMILPNLPPTRQVLWAVALARIDALSFMFETAKDGPRKLNQSEVSRVLRTLRRYESDQILQSTLPLDIYFDVQEQFDRIETAAQ